MPIPRSSRTQRRGLIRRAWLRWRTSSRPAGSPPSRSVSDPFCSGKVRVTGVGGVVSPRRTAFPSACVSTRFQLGLRSGSSIASIRITSIRAARIALDALELELSDGVTLAVPASLESITTYILLEQETWFEKELIFLRHWLQPGMTAIDIGANLGAYSLPMARLVGPTGHVFAYEPGSETRALLERSRELNAAFSLQISAFALSDAPREGRLVFGHSSELNALGDS